MQRPDAKAQLPEGEHASAAMDLAAAGSQNSDAVTKEHSGTGSKIEVSPETHIFFHLQLERCSIKHWLGLRSSSNKDSPTVVHQLVVLILDLTRQSSLAIQQVLCTFKQSIMYSYKEA